MSNRLNIQPIHPFPARMAPTIVWDSLPSHGSPLVVLDPMTGSGTTLVSARAKGHQAIGCDTDPLALLIARAWCSAFDPDQLRYRADLVLKRAKKLCDRFSSTEAYPSNIDIETRNFIDFWFDNRNKSQLTALSTSISRIHNPNEKTLLWCAFSRMIITKKIGVSLAMDVSHSRPHRKYTSAPISPFTSFLSSVEYIAKKSPFYKGQSESPQAIIRHGDARDLPFNDNCADMVITSPPYLNAIDYIRGHKLSLVWMGYSIATLRNIRSANIGSEISGGYAKLDNIPAIIKQMCDFQKLDQRQRGMVIRYMQDMDRALAECRRVLKKGGKAVFVIGDSSIRGVFIQNSIGLKHLALTNGFQLLTESIRSLPGNRRYLPPPNAESSGTKMQGRMREEVVLTFSA